MKEILASQLRKKKFQFPKQKFIGPSTPAPTSLSNFLSEGVFLKTKVEDTVYSIQNLTPVLVNNSPQVLGTGTFSKVYLYKHNFTGKKYAVKHMVKESLIKISNSLKEVYREIDIQSRIIHDNITRLYSSNENEKEFNLVLEYAKCGNLYQIINKKGSFDEDTAFKYFIQAVNAIYFLHDHNYIHRDIKPENLLLDSNGKLKLCDFGWCCEVEIGNRKTFCGTFEYMAPEIIKEEPYNKSIDIWALGVLLYEMLYGYSPFKADENESDKMKSTLSNIINSDLLFDESKKKISKECKNLIQRMVEKDIDKRITIRDVLLSDFVKKYELKMFKNVEDLSDEGTAQRKSDNTYSTNRERGKERDKEDQIFFDRVIQQVKTRKKKVRRGMSAKRGGRLDTSDVVISGDNNNNVEKSPKKEEAEKKEVLYEKPVEKDNKVEEPVVDKSVQEKPVSNDEFLNNLNKEAPQTRITKSKTVVSRLRKPSSYNVDPRYLQDSINILNYSKKVNEESSDIKEKETPKKEETFWSKLFKNFKCD